MAPHIPKCGAQAVISVQLNGFWAICGIAVRRVSDWHTGCFEKVRKEQGNENQNEFEGWSLGWRGRDSGQVSRAEWRKTNENQNKREGRPASDRWRLAVTAWSDDNEDQDEFEGWNQLGRQKALLVTACGSRTGVREEEGSKTMKTKTNVKAGPTAVEYHQ